MSESCNLLFVEKVKNVIFDQFSPRWVTLSLQTLTKIIHFKENKISLSAYSYYVE